MKLKEMYEKIKKLDPKVWIVSYIAISALLLYLYPPLQVSHFEINNTTTNATLENQYRITLAQILGGGAVAIGIYFGWKNYITAQENLKTTQEGQITERFTRAIDQLGAKDKVGNPVYEVRLGGIYALEGIANEPPHKYYSQILEILTAYVKMNSRFKEENVNIDDIHDFNKFVNSKTKVKPDIKAVMDVIKRRIFYLGEGESNGLELSETNLRQINLKDANLEGAYLLHTDLIGAVLENANLKGAYLNGAYLNWAYLNNANLEDAHLDDAHLEMTGFKDVNLKKAHFKGAFLGRAYLKGADLRGAENLTVDQLSKVYTLYQAQLNQELEDKLRANGLGFLLDNEPK